MRRRGIERRLLGTWRSDRRTTFRHLRARVGSTPAQVRRFKSLFGRMEVRWTRSRVYSRMSSGDADWNWQPYEVIASDSSSVVVRTPDVTPGEEWRLFQIVFDGDLYWVTAWPGLPEAFRRVEPKLFRRRE